jgi:branched-chain amino acid transport system permease protein
VKILGVQVSDQRLWLIGTLAVLAVVLGLFFTRTNLGLAIIGASQEPTATELVGISVRRLSTFTWVLAALLGALAAVIAVPDTGSFTPGVMTSLYLIPAFTAAVLGGMTSMPGAILGGVLVGIIQAVATDADIFQDIPGTPSTLVVFLVLLGVLIVRPQGLLGKPA